MNVGLQSNIKEHLWNRLKNITKTCSNLTVRNLGNDYIKCSWEISMLDDLRIKLTKCCFFAIRIFDITNNRNTSQATCIMKEIQVSKFQSSISFPIPINRGFYYFEFGYRKINGQWRLLAHHKLNLGYRVKRIHTRYNNDKWFISDYNLGTNQPNNIHEEAYQLSLNTNIGGSERVSK